MIAEMPTQKQKKCFWTLNKDFLKFLISQFMGNSLPLLIF